jgi:hypothetical protein
MSAEPKYSIHTDVTFRPLEASTFDTLPAQYTTRCSVRPCVR